MANREELAQEEERALQDWLRGDLGSEKALAYRTSKLGPSDLFIRVVVMERRDTAFVYRHSDELRALVDGFRISSDRLKQAAAESFLWRHGKPHLMSGSRTRIQAAMWGDAFLLLAIAIVGMIGLSFWDVPWELIPGDGWVSELIVKLIAVVALVIPYGLIKYFWAKVDRRLGSRRQSARTRRFDQAVFSDAGIEKQARPLSHGELEEIKSDHFVAVERLQEKAMRRETMSTRYAFSPRAFWARFVSKRYKRVLGPFSPWCRMAFLPRLNSSATFRDCYSTVLSHLWFSPIYIGVLAILLWVILGAFGIGDGELDYSSPLALTLGIVVGTYYCILLVQTIALSFLRHRVQKWRKNRLKDRRSKALALAKEISEDASNPGVPSLHRTDNFLIKKEAVW